jgi:cobalamin biosynthesis protein CobT
MGKKTPTTEAYVPKLPVAQHAPESGWLVKRSSHTADTARKIRPATATDNSDEEIVDDDEEDDHGDDDEDDYGDDDEDDYGDDDEDDYNDNDEDDYDDNDEDNYDDHDKNDADDDGDSVTPVRHISWKGRGQHAATDLLKTTVTPMPSENVRIPRHHSVPHTAPDRLAPTTVRQTSDVTHALTLAELTANIEARMSTRMDERIASLDADNKLFMASLATAKAIGLFEPLFCRPDQIAVIVVSTMTVV